MSHDASYGSSQHEAEALTRMARALCLMSCLTAILGGWLTYIFSDIPDFGIDMICIGFLGLFANAAYNISLKPLRYAVWAVLAVPFVYVFIRSLIDASALMGSMSAEIRARMGR
jgi:hypothetical protein